MIPAGYLRLPERYGASLWAALAKGAAHKYVRRVPTGKTTKTGKPRYRYYYHAAHGGGVGAHEHMVEGAAFQHDGGHWHIKKTDGDTLHIEHDESGKSQTVTRAELAKMLEAAHAKDLADYRAKAAARVKEARESGASAKQIAALEEHARRAAVKAEAKEPNRPGAHLTRATADDIPRSLATAAHSGTSHTPDVRAEQERNGYVEHIHNVAAQLAPLIRIVKRLVFAHMVNADSPFSRCFH